MYSWGVGEVSPPGLRLQGQPGARLSSLSRRFGFDGGGASGGAKRQERRREEEPSGCLHTFIWQGDKASFDTDSRKHTHAHTHTQWRESLIPVCRSARINSVPGAADPRVLVRLGTQTDICDWAVAPRRLVKGHLSICALIWQIFFFLLRPFFSHTLFFVLSSSLSEKPNLRVMLSV